MSDEAKQETSGDSAIVTVDTSVRRDDRVRRVQHSIDVLREMPIGVPAITAGSTGVRYAAAQRLAKDAG